MADTYYKATRPDGRDIYSGTIDYAAALRYGTIVRHPRAGRRIAGDASTYLSVSTEPANCTGMRWPCRLYRVEAVGPVGTDPSLPHKRTLKALRVVEELPAWMALGPNGEAVAMILDRLPYVTGDERVRLGAPWDAAWGAAWDAARGAAWDAARDAAWGAAWDAAWDAARDAAWGAAWDAAQATIVRDLISPEHYDILTGPWRSVMGEEAPRG